LGLLMLLTMPIQRPHQFSVHYRTTQIRRTYQRYNCVAHSQPGPSDRLAGDGMAPAVFKWLQPEAATKPLISNELLNETPVPLSHLLSRLKLGSPASDKQDPLL
ncbi:MAG: hypothetical protein ABSG46_18420, partial [Candidatus Binataceae bacterium]